ncbi:ATP synthase F1 subunit epsilon [Oscillibacter sp.]|uniref:ATP synthase F1 subunit epsilon n=1 Tax=Oscillibacter sp. TaxID=1945593 RepID=UPI0028A8FAF4|nr:ATP synthase F1 subunit epsilon [Oscillibacter sp.]
MKKTFYLEIVTVGGQFYTGEAQALMLPIQDGQYGILPGHEATVVAVEPGEVRYQTKDIWYPAVVSGGFAEITPDYVIMLVASAEHPEEIDFKRAEEARQRAEERLHHKQSIAEYYNSKASLARAMARLKTRGRR